MHATHRLQEKNVLRTILNSYCLYMIKYCFPNLVCILAGQYITSVIKNETVILNAYM